MRKYLRSRAGVRHEAPHPARLHASTPKEKRSPTIPTTSTNRNPQKTTVTVQPHCKEGLQIFYSTHCLLFFLALGSDQHQNPPGCQPRKISERSQDASQIEQKPQIAQNTILQAKPQTPTPIKLLFDFSLIYTVLRKAGNQGEQESPFSSEALLPKHYPAPQHSQTDQKNAKSRIRKRQRIKAAKSYQRLD